MRADLEAAVLGTMGVLGRDDLEAVETVVVLGTVLGASVLDPRPALEVEVLETEVVVRDPRLVLEALVRGTVGVLGEDLVEISLGALVRGTVGVLGRSVLGYASLGENEDLP